MLSHWVQAHYTPQWFSPQNDAFSQNITKNMYHDSQKTYAYFSFDYQRISAAARKTIYFTVL